MRTEILAYVDPGLGALVWQVVVSAFVGALFYLKVTRDWVTASLARLLRLKAAPVRIVARNESAAPASRGK